MCRVGTGLPSGQGSGISSVAAFSYGPVRNQTGARIAGGRSPSRGKPGGNKFAPNRIFGQPDAERPEPVIDAADQRPGARARKIEPSLIDESVKVMAQPARALDVFQPSPKQLSRTVLRVSDDDFGIDGQPRLAFAGEDVTVMEVIVDQERAGQRT